MSEQPTAQKHDRQDGERGEQVIAPTALSPAERENHDRIINENRDAEEGLRNMVRKLTDYIEELRINYELGDHVLGHR